MIETAAESSADIASDLSRLDGDEKRLQSERDTCHANLQLEQAQLTALRGAKRLGREPIAPETIAAKERRVADLWRELEDIEAGQEIAKQTRRTRQAEEVRARELEVEQLRADNEPKRAALYREIVEAAPSLLRPVVAEFALRVEEHNATFRLNELYKERGIGKTVGSPYFQGHHILDVDPIVSLVYGLARNLGLAIDPEIQAIVDSWQRTPLATTSQPVPQSHDDQVDDLGADESPDDEDVD